MNFAARLKYIREERGLSQKALAQYCNLSTQCICALEQGTRNPTGSTLKILAQFFGVTSDYLLGLEDDFGTRSDSAAMTERPPHEITDKQLIDVVKLFGVMTELQKARVLGMIIGYLEGEGVNVAKALGY